MVKAKVFMFVVGYIAFMTFILSYVSGVSTNTAIDQTEIEKPTLITYMTILINILTFQIEFDGQDAPLWFDLLINVPIYALIIFILIDHIPTVNN